MKKMNHHAISGVFVFLLLGLFAVISVVMVLFGASAYRNSNDRLEAHNGERVLNSYVHAMSRGWDRLNGIYTEKANAVRLTYPEDSDEPEIEALGQIDSIVLVRTEEDDDEGVIDRLYVFDGKLMERLQYEDEPFEPERGLEICPADEMSAEYTDGLINLRIVLNGETSTVCIAPRSGR